ncbi:MAG: hypothetical protein R2746_02445 [Acidimicrobiales bacterium]
MPARRTADRPRRVAAAAALVVGAVALTAGCSRNEFEDRTAQLDVGGESTTLELDSCGLDGTTVFVVGRGPGDVVLQAVVGVEDDGRTGVPDSTGLTVDGAGFARESANSAVLADSFGASGDESWARRGQTGRAPGTITSARVRGSRIQVAGRLEPLDVDTGRPVATSADAARPISFRLDARCDEVAG